jgi:hypothetical protein
MSFIIKSIFKSSSSLDSIVKKAVNNNILTKKGNQSTGPLNNQIKTLATRVLEDHYEGTCFQGLREKAIKSSIKQYLREEKTKAIAHLLNEVRGGFRTRLPNNITNEEIEAFIKRTIDTEIPESEKTYGQLLTSKEVKHIMKNWLKITLILCHNKVIKVNKIVTKDNDDKEKIELIMSVTKKAKPIQQVAKYLNKKIDGELLERPHSIGRILDNKAPQIDKAEFAKNKKIEFAMDKAFVSTFRDEFHFSPIERELLYNAINKQIIADRAHLSMKYEDSEWVAYKKITSNLIKTSLQPRHDAYGNRLYYSIKFKRADEEWTRDEKQVFDDFERKFDEPGFVENVRFLCDIKKANPELVEEAGLHDFRLFDLINKFAPSAMSQ